LSVNNPGQQESSQKNLIHCSESFTEQIRSIFNHAILTSTALYDYQARTTETMQAWFQNKRKGNYPVLGAVDGSNTLMGFASYGAFRAFPCYKYTIEHSVYVREDFRRCGVAEFLLTALIEEAKKQDYHVMIGVIDSQNLPSLALHRKFGFKSGGSLQEVGFKFGRWLDLEFHQLILKTPKQPVDG
jgi:L-amino acid N-acyltransferase YncA